MMPYPLTSRMSAGGSRALRVFVPYRREDSIGTSRHAVLARPAGRIGPRSVPTFGADLGVRPGRDGGRCLRRPRPVREHLAPSRGASGFIAARHRCASARVHAAAGHRCCVASAQGGLCGSGPAGRALGEPLPDRTRGERSASGGVMRIPRTWSGAGRGLGGRCPIRYGRFRPASWQAASRRRCGSHSASTGSPRFRNLTAVDDEVGTEPRRLLKRTLYVKDWCPELMEQIYEAVNDVDAEGAEVPTCSRPRSSGSLPCANKVSRRDAIDRRRGLIKSQSVGHCSPVRVQPRSR